MTSYRNRIFMGLTAAALLAAVSGCATPTSADAKRAATARWSKARAGVQYSMAQQQFRGGDLDKSEKTIAQAIQIKPDEPQYHELSARISLERGNLERAFRKLERALELDSERAEAHYLMGLVLQRWQRYEQALDSYQRSYELAPDEPSGLLAAAEMLVKLGRTDEAVSRLESKLTYFENKASIRVLLGRIHILQEKPKEAARRFRQALLLSPDDPRIREHLALAEDAAGNPVDAIYHLTRLLEHEDYEDRNDLRMMLGECLRATGKPAEARDVYVDLTERAPNNTEAWINLAEAAWLVGDRVHVSEAARRVVSLAPRRHEGYLIRGMVERQDGRPEAALAQFSHAARLAPDNALPWIMKGMTMEQNGDRQGAIRAYRRALTIWPDDPRPQRLLARLTG